MLPAKSFKSYGLKIDYSRGQLYVVGFTGSAQEKGE